MAGWNKGKRKLQGAERRAEGLSLQTIAVAAIVLVVVIVVIAIFKGGIGRIIPAVEKVNDCEPRDKCVKPGECRDGQEIYGLGCEKYADDTQKGPYCCKVQQTKGT